jgi:hypothetical protein
MNRLRCPTPICVIFFTESGSLGFPSTPLELSQNHTAEHRKKRDCNSSYIFLSNLCESFYLTGGMFTVLVKRKFSVNLQVVFRFCVVTYVKGKLSFENFTVPVHCFGISVLLFSGSRASTCAVIWGRICGFIFLAMRHAE